MDLSIFLAQLFGTYFVIVGIVSLIRRDAMRDLIKTLRSNPVLLTLIALAQVAAGLALVLTHSIFTSDYRIIISILGYWIVLEGIFYLVLSKKMLRKFLGYFSTPGWYIAGGILSVILGLYLACKGFGWWM